jgi:hypothetical protein
VRALRAFVRPPAPGCDLCRAPIAADHAHLVEVERARVACACAACATLFPHRLVRRKREALGAVEGDALWRQLGIPVTLAYLVPRDEGVAAYFPSAAGLIEAALPASAWDTVCAAWPACRSAARHVEALLLRHGRATAAYLLSIDLCFELGGLLRTRPGAVDAFFTELEAQC